jgi:hypothetical protein
MDDPGKAPDKPKGPGKGSNPNSQANLKPGSHKGNIKKAKKRVENETMLEAMRWVSIHTGIEDTTIQQGEMRKWMNKDQPGFMRYRASLEAKSLTGETSGKRRTGGPSTASDTGSAARERVRESLEEEFQLFEEYVKDRKAFLAWKAEGP